MKVSRDEFIKIFCRKRNYIPNGSIILDTEEEYELFIDKYGEPDRGAAYCDKKEIRENVSKYRIDKIKRLNITKEDFIRLYNKCPSEALIKLTQSRIPGLKEKKLRDIDTLLKEEGGFDTFYEIFQTTYISLGWLEIKTRLKLEKLCIEKHKKRAEERALQKKALKDSIQQTIVNEEQVIDEELSQDSNQQNHNEVPVSKNNKKKVYISIQKLARAVKLAVNLKELYNHQCQVCNVQLCVPNGYKSEAHHIQPYNDNHKGDDCWSNMLVVCPNCHLQFDELYFAIEPDTLTIHCFDKTNVFHGTKIKLQPEHQLEYKYLEYAWNRFSEMKSVVIEN
ncbi:HNH endonuclease [Priestia megaterium]|uniref:HNH endonuclease n=1 Tax=Priestia megaterium TaxID=1404 RepID=UPI002E1B803E|nr:HNH endonuclease [Priestia megaterium]